MGDKNFPKLIRECTKRIDTAVDAAEGPAWDQVAAEGKQIAKLARRGRCGWLPMNVRERILHPIDGTGPDALQLLATARMRTASQAADRAFTLAKRQERLEIAFGVLASISAVVAVLVIGDSKNDLDIWKLGALAVSAAAGLGTLLRFRVVKNHHWSRRAALGALAQSYEVIVVAEGSPSKDEMQALSSEWAKGHAGIPE